MSEYLYSGPRRLIGLCVTLLTIFISFTSCQQQEKGNYFYTYIQSDPSRLDPFYSTDVVSGRILPKLFNGLFRIGSSGILQKDSVRNYSFDGTRLRLTLRDDILFHNKNPLRSDDVIFSFTRIWKSSNPTSPRRWVFQNVKKITRINEISLDIELIKPSATFLYLLTMPTCYIISKSSFENDGSIVGSGPFILKKWMRDEKLVLSKNPYYFDRKVIIDGIVFTIIPEDLTARFEFLNKTLDYFELPYLARVKLDRQKELRVIDIPELSVHYIAFNTKKPPFDNRLFRTALNIAIDRESIIKKILNGRFTVAAGPVPTRVGNYNSSVTGLSYDPARAKKIIAELGLKGKVITLFIKADHQVSTIAQMIQYYLSVSGLQVKIREMDWSALKNATIKGNFDMSYFTWHADYPEAENFLVPLFYSGNIGAGGNRSFYSSKTVDRLLLRAQRTIDTNRRNALYKKVEEKIIEDAPWLFLWYGNKRIVLSKRVNEFVPYQIYNGMKGDEILLSPSQPTGVGR